MTIHLFPKYLFLFDCQDEDTTYLNNDRRGATAILTNLDTVENRLEESNSSIDENDVDEETISGENDVEYAEFSMSLQMSPKDHSKTIDSDDTSTISRQRSTANGDKSNENIRKLNRIDDDFIISLASIGDAASVSSSSSCKYTIEIRVVAQILAHVLNIMVYGPFSASRSGRNQYRTPVTSASVLETLLEPPLNAGITSSRTLNVATKNTSEILPVQGNNGLISARSRRNSNDINILADPLNIENEAIAWKWNSNQVIINSFTKKKKSPILAFEIFL